MRKDWLRSTFKIDLQTAVDVKTVFYHYAKNISFILNTCIPFRDVARHGLGWGLSPPPPNKNVAPQSK